MNHGQNMGQIMTPTSERRGDLSSRKLLGLLSYLVSGLAAEETHRRKKYREGFRGCQSRTRPVSAV